MIWLSDKTAPNITPLKKSYNIWGKTFAFETGKLALLASWSVTMSDDGDNILLVTAGFKEVWVNQKADFFPLVVDYQEKNYATWKIGWNRFMKREWRPSDMAILTARLIDRPIRPMFPKGIVNDTQIIATVLSSDSNKELWSRWITGASLTLLMAGTPFDWPVSGIKLSLNGSGEYIINPSVEDEKDAKLTLIVAWTIDAITMVEANWKEATDAEILEALEKAHSLVKELCEAQIDYIEDYKKEFGISEVKITYNKPDETAYDKVKEFLTMEKLESIYDKWKKEFQKELDKLDIETKEYLFNENVISDCLDDNCCCESENKAMKDEDCSCIDEESVWALVYKRVKEVMRENILKNERRLDGRQIDEVRQITWETGFLPRTHGSALFQRGMTQAMSITTLWWPDDEQTVDGMMPESIKRYMHHYNFPPYSVWEVRMMRWVGRREIWHGALAERALETVLPSEEEFPYIIRVVSEITTCNGSSSMASICGSSMSLMNAGVPIKSPVAWIAMWMIYNEETWDYKILSDIQAQEDFLGDMDFKLARTPKGIVAMQLDVKIKWLKMQVFKEAFSQAEGSINHILWEMQKIQPGVAEKLSPYAPLIMSIQVPVDKIREIIWKWGENVQRMEKEYGIKVSIAEDGMTTITAVNQEWWEKAVADIKKLLWVPKVWDKLEWKIARILDGIGAIVEFRGKSGMIHISKLAKERVIKVEDVVKVWDIVNIEVIQVDMMKGRIGLMKI